MSVDLSRAEREDQRRAFSEMVDANPNHWYWRELAAVEMSFLRILIGQEAADALLQEQYGFSDFLGNPHGPFKEVYDFLKGQRGMAEEAIKDSGKWNDLKTSSHEEYLAQRKYLAAFFGYGGEDDNQ